MAKSFRKQCRKPKPTKRQTGNLVVVSARDLQRATVAGGSALSGPRARKKGKRKKPNVLTDFLGKERDGSDSDDFESVSPVSSAPCTEFVFSSQHSRQQRLYYLLVTRPALGKEPTDGTRVSDFEPEGVGGVGALAEEGGCHAVVFVETVGTAQELLGELKALTLTVFALHERTPKAQAQEHIKRFLTAPSADKSSVLILTSAALAQQLSIGCIPKTSGRLIRAVHFDAPEGPRDAAARARLVGRVFGDRCAERAQEIHLEGSGDAAGLPVFAVDSCAMDGIRSRLAVAKKLARASAACAADGEQKGMQRAAAAAGIDWDDDSAHGEGGEAAVKREKNRAQAQQATALREKIGILLCQPLLSDSIQAGSITARTSTTANTQQSPKELRKKMTVLGMLTGGAQASQSASKGASEDRCAAQTRWLDGSDGRAFGGEWEGAVRNGASTDSASFELRSNVEAAKTLRASERGPKKGTRKESGVEDTLTALARWNPNPDTPDAERWGGRWGKPCGHNEVVFQHLRPFAPMEVINTRVCSKASPAPGNTGFDGCLELLCLACKERKRALTIWDDAAFIFVAQTGKSSSLPKQSMLQLPMPRLRFLMKNMRTFTVCCEGQMPPREVARAVIYTAGWGAKQSSVGPLTAELTRRVLSFVLSGDLATWRAVSAGIEAGSGVTGSARRGGQPDKLTFASKKKRHNFTY